MLDESFSAVGAGDGGGSSRVTKLDLIARVEALVPRIAACASDTDARRAVPDDIIEAMRDAEMFAVLAPRAYGGLELGLDAYSEIVRRISAASPSTGWVAAFLMGAAWRMLTFPREGQEEIYGGRNYVLGAGAAQPITGVERVEGGYRLTGRTAWNSGASHAEWFSMNGLLIEEGRPPELMIFALPRNEVTIVDTWHILGMQGTASCDIVVDGLFVPERRSAPFLPALEGRSAGHALHPNPMYHIPFLPFAMNEVLPVIVGAHRGAADALYDRIRGRMGTISGAKAAEKVPAQIRLARALGQAQAAEMLLEALVARNMAARPDARDPVSRSEMKLHAALLTQMCVDSVNDMARGVGGDSFRDEALFQRYFRDLNVVARHAFLDLDTAGESYAKLLLGLPTSDPLI